VSAAPGRDATDDRAQLVARLRDCLGADHVIDDAESLRVFECDALTIYRELPLAVAQPGDSGEVSAVLRLCHQAGVPVVARGAGTGLCAGAMPHPEGVLLSLSRLDRLLAVDPVARTATVQPGVTNLAISQAAQRYGLYYAPDPSSQVACSIGGNVASNSGGVHCLKYGLTVHNLMAMKVLTVEGDELALGGPGPDNPGYDLMALLTGSEGLLGVVTEITVRLLPVPPLARVVLAGFDSVHAAGDAVGEVIAAGIIPAGLEMMDNLAIRAAEDFCRAGYPRDAAAILLCEVDGTEAEVAQHSAQVAALLRDLGATSVRVSRDEAERALLWKGRKAAFPAVGRLAPDYYCMDGTIPRGQVSHVLEEISRLSAHYALPVANVFHAGDGNLHPLILFDAGDPAEIRKAEAFGADILELSVRVGGAITGEHGVGVEKLRQMPHQFSERELLQLEEIKHAFDPGLTLNPGKGIPILKRCQEYRALPDRSREQAPGTGPAADCPPQPRVRPKRALTPLACSAGDIAEELAERVRAAYSAGRPLYIRAGDSKRHLLGRACDAEELDVSAHRGIVDYQPRELVITARAGTPLAEIEAVLAAQGQRLAAEPPQFGGAATLGGTLAADLSGPARPWGGSLRDAVLGVALINGRGEHLAFGGRVIKNVAGYDVSRLQAGALGTLGVLCDITLKVAPRPEHTLTLGYAVDAAEAVRIMNHRSGEPAPLDGACWSDGRLLLRLSGAARAVAQTAERWGGDSIHGADDDWHALREMRLPLFAAERPLWRLSVQSPAPPDAALPPALLDWAGARRWVHAENPALALDSARRAGGHACLFRGGDRRAEVRAPLGDPQQRLHARLKKAFDPAGVLNRGRLYSWM